MPLITRKKIKLCFTTLCVIVVAFMIGYWFYKFEVEDRDIGVVDYVWLRDATEVKYPAASICFRDPFIDGKIKEVESSITRKSYGQYLKGWTYSNQYRKIDYQNVTLNVNDYFLFAEEQWINETRFRNISVPVEHVEVFNGLHDGAFLKCFLINFHINMKRLIKVTRFYYDRQMLENDWLPYTRSNLKACFMLHYPGQFFLRPEFFCYYVLGNVPPKKLKSVTIYVKELEMLQRRNKPTRECIESTEDYDDMIIEQHLIKNGCQPPYLEGRKPFPECNSAEKMKDSQIDLKTPERMKMSRPCNRISRISTKRASLTLKYKPSPTLKFEISFPSEVKLITQSKDVDIHSLIGNIGGYLGCS